MLPKTPRLIGIHGKASSGKDTVALYLHKTRPDTYIEAFALSLKAAAAAMFGIPEEDFYDSDVKEKVNEIWGVSPRQIAQFFGTELVRNNIGRLLPENFNDFWVARLCNRITNQLDDCCYELDDTIVIPDVRFQNEYEFVIDNGGIIIHLTRDGADGNVGITSHPSEAGIHFSTPERTFHVTNNSTLDDLYGSVDAILATTNFYPLSNPDNF